MLTHPESIRRWSPVDFDLDELSGRRLAAGTRGRVTGRVAGVTVGFDLEVHAADEARLELSAEGPVAFDVRYELMPHEAGSSLNASVTVRRGDGITGRLVEKATRRAAVRRRARRCGRPDRPRGGVAVSRGGVAAHAWRRIAV